MPHYIYITTCKINGKKYLGQHNTDLIFIEDMQHDGYLGTGMLQIRAIKKYGKENFEKEILAVFANQEMADKKEIEYIEKLKVIGNKNRWYNRSLGGQYWRHKDHGSFIGQIMRNVWKRDEYRISKGLSTVAEMQERENKRQERRAEREKESEKKKKNVAFSKSIDKIFDSCTLYKEAMRDKWIKINRRTAASPRFKEKVKAGVRRKIRQNKQHREGLVGQGFLWFYD